MKDINIIFLSLNAKYVHSSLSIRYLYSYSHEFKDHITMAEFTINNSEDFTVGEICKLKPKVLCFSCYIWNIEIIKNVISTIKKVMPNIIIVLGGPEVSYDFNYYIEKYADFIVVGEGEQTIKELIQYFLNKNEKSLKDIKGLAYKDDNSIVVNQSRQPLELSQIPFVYKDGFKDLKNKIIYYETSRGCPFSCQYCLSANDKQLRFLPLNRVKEELKFFLDEKVPQVKFIDRTFNCNKPHAMAIWAFLIENDNNISNFHFEISADLLNDEMINLLKTARKGLFQFEIGIQSTNVDTLYDIKRQTDLKKVFKMINLIGGNINKHLDLIVGLPNETYESFKNSFNMVYGLNPDKLQLGFLKLLRGSGLRQNSHKYGLVYKDAAPYEVLYNKYISFEEVRKLKFIEEMVEIFYNSNKFVYTNLFAISYFKTSFDFYSSLASYWEKNNYHYVSHSKIALYEIMRNFLLEVIQEKEDQINNLLKFDIYLNDNVKNLPPWAKKDKCDKTKEKIKLFYEKEENKTIYFSDLLKYTPQQLSRICHIECFDYNVVEWLGNKQNLKPETTYVLFKYAIKGESSFSFLKVDI